MGVLFDALTTRARANPSAPFVTWYGSGGERAELSGVTFATAVAKTAGALVDEWDIDPGTRVRLDLPLHWQVGVWLAACDLAGLIVVFDDTDADLVVNDQLDDPVEGKRHVLTATTAFGLPGAPVPDPVLDHARDSMGQPDAFLAVPQVGAWHVAGRLWPVAQIVAAATDLAARLDVGPDDRLLVTPATDPLPLALAVWPVPLITGAGVVMCPTDRAAAVEGVEHVTVRVGRAGEP